MPDYNSSSEIFQLLLGRLRHHDAPRNTSGPRSGSSSPQIAEVPRARQEMVAKDRKEALDDLNGRAQMPAGRLRTRAISTSVTNITTKRNEQSPPTKNKPASNFTKKKAPRILPGFSRFRLSAPQCGLRHPHHKGVVSSMRPPASTAPTDFGPEGRSGWCHILPKCGFGLVQIPP